MEKNWIWSDHIEWQLSERKIAKDIVEQTIDNPDEIVKGHGDRLVYHKMMKNKLIRVVIEDNVIITVYLTNKIKKYWKGETNK